MSTLSGPAGVACIELAGGDAELVVDYDEPAAPLDITATPAAIAAVRWIFGAVIADAVVAGDDPDLPHTLMLNRLAPVVVLATDLEERDLDELALGVGLIELAVAVAELPGARDLQLPWRPSVLADRGMALVVSSSTDLSLRIPRFRWAALDRLARAVGGVPGVDRDLHTRMYDFVDSALRSESAGPMRMPAALPSPAPIGLFEQSYEAQVAHSDAAAGRPAVRAPTLDVVFDAGVDAHLLRASRDAVEADVVVDGEMPSGGLWMRVDRRSGGTAPVPLAVVPFEQDRFGPLQARALLSPEEPTETLMVTVTSTPWVSVACPSLLAARRGAVWGREAVRLDRIGDDAASDRWQRSAHEWDLAGDVQRAELAMNRATLGVSRRGQPTFAYGRSAGLLLDDLA